jgi:uncharacterized protein YicC (UPF0701 family)
VNDVAEHEEPDDRDTLALLSELRDELESKGTLPLSSTPRMNRDDILAYLDAAIDRLPEELHVARRLLRDREEFLAKTKRDGLEILETARQRAAAMVEKEAVVRKARKEARTTIDDAEEKARQRQHDADDYVDQKLAAFEIVLERISAQVANGRDRLQLHVTTPILDQPESEPDHAFFDQDTNA